MNNDDLLQKIRSIVKEEIKAETEPIKKRLDGMDKRLDGMDKRLDQQGTDMNHLSTALEVVAESQKEIQSTMATKVEVLSLGLKIDKNHRSTNTRLQHLEEQLGTNDPTKN